MKKQPLIYKKINSWWFRGHTSFHMPGHKSKAPFSRLFRDADIDVTELSYTDDLQHPTGVIAQAQKDVAEILGARHSYFLTDGSTSGVMSLVYMASRRGSKLIVARNSHKSVFNACRLLGVEPVIVQGDEMNGVLQPPEATLIEKLFVNDFSIAGILVTSPDYYGTVAPLEKYARICDKYDRLLLCDGAHGTHLAFGDDKKLHASSYADAWVDGAHKTLPTLTQGAILSVNADVLVPFAEEALSIFRTTSPSYPIMASIEYGVKYAYQNQNKIKKLKEEVRKFIESSPAFTFYPSDDWAKIAIDFKPLNISADVVAERLEKKNIYVEMADGRYIVFYLSLMNEPKDLKILKEQLLLITTDKRVKNTYKQRKSIPQTDRSYSFLYSFKQEAEYVPLQKAVGRMAAENAGITPPCIPILIAGEFITPAVVEFFLGSNKNTFGIKDGTIRVVKR